MHTISINDWKTVFRQVKTKFEHSNINNSFFNDLLKQPKMRKYYKVSGEEIAAHTTTSSSYDKKRDEKIELVLSLLGMTEIDLDGNTGIVNKQPRKIGKFLKQSGFSHMEKTMKRRNNLASNKANQDYYIVISAHPYDVMTASYRRSWTSCMNLDEGCEAEYMIENVLSPNYLGLITYIVKDSDKNIRNPVGRAFLNGYELNESEDSYTDLTFNGFGYSVINVKNANHSKDFVFNMSDRFYGKCPSYVKWKLSNICKEEINAEHISKGNRLKNLAYGRSYYLDSNDTCITSLRTTKKPKHVDERQKTKTQKEKSFAEEKKRFKNGYDHSLNNVIKFKDLPNYYNKSWSPSVGWWHSPDDMYDSSWGTYMIIKGQRPVADRAKWIRRIDFDVLQMKAILDANPSILKSPKQRKTIRQKGKYFELLVDNYEDAFG